MHFLKYYKNETFTYWFLSFMPIIIFIQVYEYAQVAQNSVFDDRFLAVLFWLCVGPGATLVLFQMISQIRFGIELMRVSPEIKAGIANEVVNGTKQGRYLKTSDVVIYYGMFVKKVILSKDIVYCQNNKGDYSFYMHRAGRVTVKYAHTVILTKDGTRMVLERPMDSLPGELPYNSLIVVFLIGLFFYAMTIYPKFMDTYTGADPIERLLVYASHDAYYCMGSIGIIAIIGIVAFVLRYKFFPSGNDDSFGMFLIVVAFAISSMLAFAIRFEDTEHAVVDLAAYHAGEFEVEKRSCEELKKDISDSNDWGIDEYMERLSVSFVVWELPDARLLIVEKAFDELPETGATYRVEYLKNTELVVKFEKIE